MVDGIIINILWDLQLTSTDEVVAFSTQANIPPLEGTEYVLLVLAFAKKSPV